MKFNKICNIFVKAIAWLLVAFTVAMMIFTVVSVTTVDQNNRSLLGMKFYIVRSDSMSPSEANKDLDVHFSAGDIVIIRNTHKKMKLEAGDVISFVSMNEKSYGETVTHMIREVKTDDNGRVIGYVTFGTNTNTNDKALVEPEYVLGKYIGKLPRAGNFFAYVKTTPGYIICILIPFLLLILYNGINVIRLFKQYKKEQTALFEAEKAEIAAERQRNEQMLRELQALKEQLIQQNGTNNKSDSDTEQN